MIAAKVFLLIAAAYSVYAQAGPAELKAVSILPQGSKTRVVITLDRETTLTHGYSSDPPRFYVDLADTRVGLDRASRTVPSTGIVELVRVGQNTPDVARVVVNIEVGAVGTFIPDPDASHIVIEIAPAEISRAAEPKPATQIRRTATLRAAMLTETDRQAEIQLSLVDNALVGNADLGKLTYQSGYLHQPERFYVDLRDTVLDKDVQRTISSNGALISSVRLGQNDPRTTRLVIALQGSVEAAVKPAGDGSTLAIEIRSKNARVMPASFILPQRIRPPAPVSVDVLQVPDPPSIAAVAAPPPGVIAGLDRTFIAPVVFRADAEPALAVSTPPFSDSRALEAAVASEPGCGAFERCAFSERGFFENRTLLYPQSGFNDSGLVVSEATLRLEASYRPAKWLTFNAAFDALADTHRQVARTLDFDVDGRTIQRPAFTLRRMSATLRRGKFSAEIGRQIIRWGKTDILTPTDRFAPKDYVSSVVDTDYLGVTAARATYEFGSNTIDLIWQPWFTPSRTPLLNQRWTAVPVEASGVALQDNGARYPGGSQFGVRWNHIAKGLEYSLSYFNGRQNLPSFDAALAPLSASSPNVTIALDRTYPALRMYGADAALPLNWFTVKGETAYMSSSTPGAEEYVLYVVQLERLVKEWSFVGGYAGNYTTRAPANPLQFAADRGFARSFVGRAGLTIDANRSLALETAIRAAGSFVRFEYTQAIWQHWRVTGTAAWIRGDMDDFLGQYRRNSYVSLAIRYSF